MIYAKRDGTKTIIAAADSMSEFETFFTDLAVNRSDLSLDRPDVFQTMTEYPDIKYPPIVVEHPNASYQDKFLNDFSITILHPVLLSERCDDMIARHKAERRAIEDDDTGPVTIGELYGIDKEDPFDKRTEAEKLKDAERKEEYEKLEKEGKLTGGGSFTPSTPGGIRVSDIKGTVDPKTGKIVDVSSVIAHKNMENEESKTETKGTTEDEDADDFVRQMAIDPVGALKARGVSNVIQVGAGGGQMTLGPNGLSGFSPTHGTWYRVAVANVSSNGPRQALDAKGSLMRSVANVQDNASGCSLDWPSMGDADKAAQILEDAGYSPTITAISENGKPLAPEGIRVITEDQKDFGPRPWNEPESFAALPTEDSEKILKKIKGEEFYFCCSPQGRGTSFSVVPKIWFDREETLFDQPLGINRLLPPESEEISPGRYYVAGLDWMQVSHHMNSRGFHESMLFQLYVNML